jgi:tyrosine-protein kinase Etk/Wzc
MGLLDLVTVPLKWKRVVAGMTLGAALVSVAVSLLLPVIYRAETRILPPSSGGSGMAAQVLGQLGGGIGGLVSAALGGKAQSELYVEMLKSRTVLDAVIERFDLRKLYREEKQEDARERLLRVLLVRDDKKSGVIHISVEDRDPARAAAMANAFVEELRKLTGGLAVTEAAQRRLFFEERLKESKEALGRAEDRMKGFQEKTGALHVESQARAVLQSLAYLKAQVSSREVALRIARTYATPQNPDVERIEEELKGLREEMRKLEAKGGPGPDPMMTAGSVPSVGVGYLRNVRDLKYNEALFELMAKQYELARIDEARDPAIVQVIDRAVPPGKKAKPLRGLITLLGTAAGFFLSLLLAFFLDFLERTGLSASGPQVSGRLFRGGGRVGARTGG